MLIGKKIMKITHQRSTWGGKLLAEMEEIMQALTKLAAL
jgi:hypothetical protein